MDLAPENQGDDSLFRYICTLSSDQDSTWIDLLYHYISTLSVLASPPTEQCEIMDNYNVAWELWDDGLEVDYFLNQTELAFTDVQIEKMKDLSMALHSLGPADYSIKIGSRPEEFLQAMGRPGWAVVRELANRLLIELTPAEQRP